MPHSRSAQKRLVQSEKARLRNKSLRSSMKTAIKKVVAAADAGDVQAAAQMLPEAIQRIDKAAKKHAIHANAAARKKSQVQSHVQRKSKPAS